MSWIRAKGGTVFLKVWLQTKASKLCVDGVLGDALKVKVTAAPIEGKANKQLCRALAKWLQIPVAQVNLKSGQKSSQKLISVSGLKLDEVERRLLSQDR